MEAIDELSQLSDSMKQAASLLADEDPDETSSSKRPATFLNVVALGNVVSSSLSLLSLGSCWFYSVFECMLDCHIVDLLDLD